MSTAATPRRPRGEAARDALVEAALRVIEREGVAAATTRQISEEAGLPLGTLHYWFRGKDELVEAVVRRQLDDTRAAATAAFATHDARERLVGAFRSLVEDDPTSQLAYLELTAHALRTPALRHLVAEQHAAYREISRKGAAPWAGRADTALPGGADALTTLIAALFDGLTLATVAGEPPERAVAALDLLAHLLDAAGMGAHAPEAQDGRPDRDAGDGARMGPTHDETEDR